MANTKVQSKGLTTTGVGAGSYTSASITVDSQGRITAASSGSAGAGMGIPTLEVYGPSSGTYTATPTASRLGVYMWAGGGAGSNNGQSGGSGGYGFYNKVITQPFSQPYSVGAGGNFPGGAGNAGGATNFTNVGTVNGGAGGPQSMSDGANGNAPGASLVGIRNHYIGPGASLGGSGGNAGQVGALVILENTGT